MIPKGSPKGFAYAAIHFAHVLVKNSTYANLTQEVCSTWSLRNLTQHNVFLTPQIDMTQMLNGMSREVLAIAHLKMTGFSGTQTTKSINKLYKNFTV